MLKSKFLNTARRVVYMHVERSLEIAAFTFDCYGIQNMLILRL